MDSPPIDIKAVGAFKYSYFGLGGMNTIVFYTTLVYKALYQNYQKEDE